MKKIKKVIMLFIILVIAFSCDLSNQNIDTPQQKYTTLQVFNPTNDTIITYLTIDNNGSSWITNVNGIFGIKSSNNLQGKFILLPNELVSYTSQKPFSGNISFNNPPLNCPFPAPTLYEFTLNNYGIITKAQETIDISCVYGVTTIGQFTLSNGGVWNSGQNDTIKTIKNNLLYKNTGVAGVYPYGCTTCTGRSGMVDCSNKKTYENTNTKNICNVQRDARNSGGIVKITYLKSIN